MPAGLELLPGTLDWSRYFFPYCTGLEALWFDLLALLVIGCFFDFKQPWRLRNLDLLMICCWVPLGDYEKGHLPLTVVLGYLPLFYFLPRLLHQVGRRAEEPCVVNYGPRWLTLLTALALLYGVGLALVAPYPYASWKGSDTLALSDSAVAGMLGANALRAGKIPYGNLPDHRDDYGPAYYYSYLPFMFLQVKEGYFLHEYGAPARALAIVAHVAAILGFGLLGWRLRSAHYGLALAFAWACLPYSLISLYWSQTGHLLTGALLLWSCLALSCSQLLGAAVLAWTSAAAFFPVFFIPAWAATLRERKRAVFLGVVLGLGLALWLPMLDQPDGLRKFFDSTVVYFQVQNRGEWSPWVQHPMTLPVKSFFSWMFLPFVAWVSWRARGRGFVSLMAITGAIVVFTQFFSLHAPGRYQLWMMPFLLPVLLLGTNRTRFEDGAVDSAEPEAGCIPPLTPET